MWMLRVLMAAALSATATTGRAAVLLNQGDVGTTIQVDYLGSVLGLPTSGLGALSNFVYTGTSNEGRSYNFSYSLTNDSSLTSRVRSFGFDVLGATPLALSSTGTYSTPISNPLAGVIGTDLCFTVATLGGCSSGSGGLSAGQATTGSFSLTFAQSMATIELANFAVNFQGVGGLLAGTGAGDVVVTSPALLPGGAVSAAPESATWLMMILGFGLVGGAMRRRSSILPLAGRAIAYGRGGRGGKDRSNLLA